MRVLLIGGNGFIGLHLIRELRGCGHEVAVFHRGVHSLAVESVVEIQGDRNRLPQYRDQVQKFAPDVIVDLVLSSGEQASQLMEVVGGLVEHVVALSSMDVYRAWGVLQGVEPEAVEPLPLTEDSALRSVRQLYSPETLKGMQGIFPWLDERYDKIAVEQVVLNASAVKGTVLRLPMVYGPGDNLHRLFPLVKRFADKRDFIILADDFAAWRGPRGYVENVAHAIALAATSKQSRGRIYNVCDEPVLTELEWQRQISREAGWGGRLLVLPRDRTPKHLLFPGNAAQQIVVTSERIRKELGYKELVQTNVAIRRTLAWEERNPPSVNPQQFDYAAEDAAVFHAA